jgi:hypothetical protein
LLGFKTAVNGSLAKYNLQDQIIDEYEDATGIDAGNSTNEVLASGAYVGATAPTISQDADATGTDGLYSWYKWTDTAATGSYDTDTTQDHEWLIVGGGGSGGKGNGGAGGAGGYRTGASLSLTGGNEYTVTVGAGGASQTSNGAGNDGSDSILSGTGITTITSTGGGGGGGSGSVNGQDGGSGGGSDYQSSSTGGSGNTPSITPISGETTTVQGYDGGIGGQSSPEHGSGAGGGAGAVGADGTAEVGGVGGVGVANDIIETGTNVYYAGGGGGSANYTNSDAGAGGNGGGGAGGGGTDAGTAGTANTGGGGGAGHAGNSGAGGSGIVILRRLTNVLGGDLTLQSTANTASSAATKADLIMLMENAEGTATINTDIKGYVTADGGSNWTEGTLVDEGSWGTNKKILAFHDATVTSGTDMRYKITTHNQSAGSKETKIHATSIGWKA